jgi:parallel beta-helix repeat protein
MTKVPVCRATAILRVPRDYPTIQAAVDAANPGDTILVANGTYNERVTLYKDNLTLLGQNTNGTIIDSNWIDQPLLVTGSNIYVSGFTLSQGGYCGVYLYYADNVSIVGNIIANNTDYGIYIENSSDCLVAQNTIANNYQGICLWDSESNKIYHNNFFNTIQVLSGYSTNTWDNGYPSGGNYWSDYLTIYPNATEIDNSGIWNTPYVVDIYNQDNYPLMNPYGSPAVAVFGITLYKTVVSKGYNVSIYVTVANLGGDSEIFNVTGHANTTSFGLKTIALGKGVFSTILFTWDTAGFAYGSYTISANVTLAPGETNSWTGPFIYGTVKVTIPGDINGDGVVNLKDITLIALHWLQKVPPAPANADINGDGVINLKDVTIIALNWLKHA